MEMKHSIKGVLDIELKLLISIIQYFPCWRERVVAMIVFYFLYLLSLRQITTTVFYFLLLGILRQQKKYCSSLSLRHTALSGSILFFCCWELRGSKKNTVALSPFSLSCCCVSQKALNISFHIAKTRIAKKCTTHYTAVSVCGIRLLLVITFISLTSTWTDCNTQNFNVTIFCNQYYITTNLG